MAGWSPLYRRAISFLFEAPGFAPQPVLTFSAPEAELGTADLDLSQLNAVLVHEATALELVHGCQLTGEFHGAVVRRDEVTTHSLLQLGYAHAAAA